MAFFQKPAMLDEANKLLLTDAQVHLHCDKTEEDLAIDAALYNCQENDLESWCI